MATHNANYRLNIFPIVFVSSLSGKPFEYELCEFGKLPTFFPGMELTKTSKDGSERRWSVDRVHYKDVDERAAVFVLCSPCTVAPFTTTECSKYVSLIYDELITSIEELDAKKNQDEDDSYKWN